MNTPFDEIGAVDPQLQEKIARAPIAAPTFAPAPARTAKIKADDLSRRGIAFYTAPSGMPKEITDPNSGQALTGFDKRNSIAWDAQGTPQKINFDAATGSPQLTPAYDTVPDFTDTKTGNVYRAPKGLPWQQTGEDPAIKETLRRKEVDRINRETSIALAPVQREAATKYRDAYHAVKASAKATAAQFDALGVPTVDAQKLPTIDLLNGDAGALRTHIESSFNREYGSDAANAKPLFGGGQYSDTATAIRKDIDLRKQHAMEVADAHLSALDQMRAHKAALDELSAQRKALVEQRLGEVNAQREQAGLPPATVPQDLVGTAGAQSNPATGSGYPFIEAVPAIPSTDLQTQGELDSSQAHNLTSAGSTPAPAITPDRSFSSALLQGLDQPLEGIGTTAQVLGLPGLGGALKGAIDTPTGYESASERFINPQEGDFTIGGFAPAQLPRAIVEQFGQLGGSIISRVAGGLLGGALGGLGGGAAGAPTGPGAVVTGGAGAVTGATAGAFVGPFLFGALQIAGPSALERAKNNGRTDPNGDDIAAALLTAAGSGALDSIGAQFLPGGKTAIKGALKKIVGAFVGEGATEGGQSLVEQTGETLGTDRGLDVNLKQAAGEAVLGGVTGGVASGIEAGVNKARAKPAAEPPPLPTESDMGNPITEEQPEAVAGSPSSSLGDGAAEAEAGLENAAPLEAGLDVEPMDAKSLSDLGKAESLLAQAGSLGDTETRRGVLRNVLRTIQSDEVLDAIIPFIPVDVVNVLTGKKLTTEMLREDHSVLKQLFSSNHDVLIAPGVKEAVMLGLASIRAESAVSPGGLSGENSLTKLASERNLPSDVVATPTTVGAKVSATPGDAAFSREKADIASTTDNTNSPVELSHAGIGAEMGLGSDKLATVSSEGRVTAGAGSKHTPLNKADTARSQPAVGAGKQKTSPPLSEPPTAEAAPSEPAIPGTAPEAVQPNPPANTAAVSEPSSVEKQEPGQIAPERKAAADEGRAPSTEKPSVEDIVPAFKVNGETVRGQKLDTHLQAKERFLADKDDDTKALTEMDFDTKENPNFFVDTKTGRDISREQLKALHGVSDSQGLRKLQESRSSAPTSADSSTLERLGDSRAADVDRLSNILKGHAFTSKGFSGLDVPLQREVHSLMVRAISDREVLDSVVQLIPVDVVNNLTARQLTPEMALHDEAVFRELFSGNRKSAIALPVNIASSLIRRLAYASGAESDLKPLNVIRSSSDGFPAKSANALHELDIAGDPNIATGKTPTLAAPSSAPEPFTVVVRTLDAKGKIVEAQRPPTKELVRELSKLKGIYSQLLDCLGRAA